jgi:hypothetical protein
MKAAIRAIIVTCFEQRPNPFERPHLNGEKVKLSSWVA